MSDKKEIAHPAAAANHLYLIDGSGFIFRAYHALPPLTRPDGTPVNAVLGFTNLLLKLLNDVDADHLAVIFDSARENFRHAIDPNYKANRPDPPDDLLPQFSLIREATKAFQVPCLEIAGFEADDIIATYAKQAESAGFDVTIVSSDKDLMQLVSARVTMWDAVKNRRIRSEQVKEKFGVGPEQVVDVQALAGDSTDNVPGVPGIGVKTAAQLIQKFGDLDTLLARTSEIPQTKRRENLMEHAEKARLSRELVRLRCDVPVDVPIADLVRHDPDPDILLTFLAYQGFKSVAAKVQHQLQATGTLEPRMTSPAFLHPRSPSTTIYELVQTATDLQDWATRARYAGFVAIDTETTSLDQSRAELVGISLSLQPEQACYIPLAHRAPDEVDPVANENGFSHPRTGPSEYALQQIPLDQALSLLAPLLSDPAVLKVGHNIKYDMVILVRYGLAVNPVDDTMLMSYVLDGGSHGHGMDELAQLHLGHKTIQYKDVTGTGKTQVTFDRVPLDQALPYAAEDADITLRLHHVLKPRLIAEHLLTVYETLERPLIPVLANMEAEGIYVDRTTLGRLSQEFTERLQALEQDIHQLVGHPFNVASPKQVGDVLFQEMGLAGGQKGKTGAYSTSADVLEMLAGQGHALPAKILDWRQLEKLRSTYSDALLKQIHPQTGRVHTSFAMAAASTGRLSSTDPNLQNIPVRTEEGRKIRRAFLAEAGRTFLSLDYSQIELRLLAHMAEIDVLKHAFREGQDIHALTASQVFGVPIEELDPLLRRKAKAINFGIIYGISPFGLARQLNIPQGEAAAYIEAYFQRYPGIQEYMEQTKQVCRERGYVETLFGRRCHILGINERNPAKRNFAERAAINAPIQGTAADILKRAMIRVPPALDQQGLSTKAHLLLTVHDELLFEVEEEALEHTTNVVKTVMESAHLPALSLDIPLTVDVGHGDTWDQAH
ncbi:MAG: DNA polymerase I [Nitrospirales bacterium]|nr:DNA polymerase I [Nitrospirales bacterium]